MRFYVYAVLLRRSGGQCNPFSGSFRFHQAVGPASTCARVEAGGIALAATTEQVRALGHLAARALA